MDVTERTVRTARIEVPGGREVRVVRWTGEDGGHLDLSVSWPEAPLGGRGENSIRLPGDALPEVVQALERLKGSP